MPAAPVDVGPVTERELVEQVNTGRTAEALLAEPLIARWFADVDATIIECLRRASAAGSKSEFEHWSLMLETQELQKKAFLHYMRTGSIAESQLRQKNLILRRVSRWKWEWAKPQAA